MGGRGAFGAVASNWCRGQKKFFTTDITNYHGFRIRTSLVPGSAGVIRGANGSEFFGVHLQARLRVAFQKLR